MKIAYECATVRTGASGIGRMAERLAHAVDALLDPSDELWLMTNERAPDGLRAAPSVGPHRPTPLWMQTAVPRILRRGAFDLAHFTNSTAPAGLSTPYVTTIHDLSLVRFPETHPFRRRLYQGTLLRRSAQRARRVLTISEASARDVVELLDVPPEHVVVTPLAADARFREVTNPDDLRSVRARHRLEGPYVLYVGNVEPRKNLVRLVDAFARVAHGDATLAIAGGLAWKSGKIEECVRAYKGPGSVRLLGYVPDDDLPALYSAADAFAYVSMWEGFGLPVVEAMACGVPVLTSRIPALVEVVGEAAVLVDPLDCSAIADGLDRLLSSATERAALRAAGLARAAEFTWERTARLTIDAYHSALTKSA